MKALIKFRNLCESFLVSARRAGDPGNRELVERFKKKHQREIEEVDAQLRDLALIKLFNDVGARRSPASMTDEPGLFAAMRLFPMSIKVPIEKKGREVRVPRRTMDATLDEIDAWIGEERPRKRRSATYLKAAKQVAELRRLGYSGDTVLLDALKDEFGEAA